MDHAALIQNLPSKRAHASVDPYPLVLFLLPFLLLLISSNWMFSPVGSIDPWVYYGYFRNLAHFEKDLFPGTYYGSRLSWILPGYLIHTLLAPLPANYVLHLTFYYIAVFSCYSILKYAAGPRSAFLGSLLLGCYPFFLKSIGWDYVDGAGIAYYFLTAAFLTQAGRSASPLWPTLAGFSYAALIYSNLFCVTFSPFLLGYYVAAARHHSGRVSPKALVSSLLFIVLGFALLTLTLGTVSYFVADTFWFYAPSIAYALGNIGKANPWRSGTVKWVLQARWLVLPVLTVVVMTVILLWQRMQKKSSWNTASAVYAAIFLGSFAVMVLWEIMGNPVLEFDYYASYLIPPMFVAIGSHFGSVLDRLRRAGLFLVAASAIALCSLPLWATRSHGVDQLARKGGVLVTLAVGLAWPMAVGIARNRSWALPVVLAAIVGNYYLVRPDAFEFGHSAKDAFVRITEAAQVIKREAGNRRVRFWYSRKEKDFFEFYSLNSVYLWGYTGIGMDFPSLASGASLAPGDMIVIPSSDENVLEEGNGALKTRGLKAGLWSRKEIHHGGVRFFLTLAEAALDVQAMQTVTLSGSAAGPQRLIQASDAATPH